MDNINNKIQEGSGESAPEAPIERDQEREAKEKEARIVPEENVKEELKKIEEEMIFGSEPEITEDQKVKVKDDEDRRIENLLILAEREGIRYAIEAAKKLGDPNLLDHLHDTLAKESLYKKFKE